MEKQRWRILFDRLRNGMYVPYVIPRNYEAAEWVKKNHKLWATRPYDRNTMPVCSTVIIPSSGMVAFYYRNASAQ